MKSEKEVRRALKECYSWKKYYDQMDEKELGNNEGWIEALQFVLTSSEQPKQGKLSSKFLNKLDKEMTEMLDNTTPEELHQWLKTKRGEQPKQEKKPLSKDNCVVCGKYLKTVEEEEQMMCNACEIRTSEIAKEIEQPKQVSEWNLNALILEWEATKVLVDKEVDKYGKEQNAEMYAIKREVSRAISLFLTDLRKLKSDWNNQQPKQEKKPVSRDKVLEILEYHYGLKDDAKNQQCADILVNEFDVPKQVSDDDYYKKNSISDVSGVGIQKL